MYRMLTGALFLGLGLCSHSALAWKCTTLTPSTTVSPQNITIARDLPVGSIIGTQVVTPTISAFQCEDTETGFISNQDFGVKALGTFDSVQNGRRIYKTSLEGIGYSISGSSTNCAEGNATVDGSNSIRGDVNNALICTTSDGILGPVIDGTVTVTFYKTAAETGSGTVNGRAVGSLIVLTNTLLWQYPEATVNISSFTVTTPACKLTTASVPVDMKDVDRNAFHGKDSTPGDAYTRAFTLPMTCNAGTDVSVKMEGDIFDAAKGVFNISGGNNAASGVGIQLLYDNQPMPLGSDVAVGSSIDVGGFTVPLKARYYQTGDRITPGTANGMLSFTMTYQ